MTKNTDHHIIVFYKKQEIYSFQFTTNLYSNQELIKQGQEQTAGDVAFAKADSSLTQQQPWYRKLPIETDKCRITYDFNKQSFRIRFLTSPSSSQDKSLIISEALANLKSIGVDEAQGNAYYVIELPTIAPTP